MTSAIRRCGPLPARTKFPDVLRTRSSARLHPKPSQQRRASRRVPSEPTANCGTFGRGGPFHKGHRGETREIPMSRVQGNACGTTTIYYLHPRLAGSLAAWKPHFAHAAALGFSHVCVGPIFVPAANGDIFLVDDYEATDPAIAAAQAADGTTARLAELGRDSGLQLLLELVLA